MKITHQPATSSGFAEDNLISERFSTWRRIFGHRGLLLGGCILLALVGTALWAPWIAPHDPYAQDLERRLVPPFWHDKGDWIHPLGTDGLGRDYLSRLIYGARISLLIGISTVSISSLIGSVLGILAGYFGGRLTWR